MTVEALTQSVCDLALGFGEGGRRDKKKTMSRPFGVALLMAGYDEKGPQLFFSDPSGTFLQYKAKSIGAGSEGAQSTLQDKYRADMTLIDAENLALEILKQVMEEKVANYNVELASVTQAVSTRLSMLFIFQIFIFSFDNNIGISRIWAWGGRCNYRSYASLNDKHVN